MATRNPFVLSVREANVSKGERPIDSGLSETALGCYLLAMFLHIKNRDADRLARTIAKATGESITEAVKTALRERLARVQRRRRYRSLADELDEIAKRCAALPVLDARSAGKILGYDGQGLPRGR